MDGKQYMQKAYESIIGNDFERAIEWFEKAVAVDPLNAFYHYSLSITSARSNKLGKAIEHAAEASRLEPSSVNYKLHLNTIKAKQVLMKVEQWIYKDHQRIGEAISELKNAIDLDPFSVEAFIMLAVAYATQEHYAEAIQTLTEASRLDPQHKEIILLLAEYQALLSKQSGKEDEKEFW